MRRIEVISYTRRVIMESYSEVPTLNDSELRAVEIIVEHQNSDRLSTDAPTALLEETNPSQTASHRRYTLRKLFGLRR
jgi:hypothetical protein